MEARAVRTVRLDLGGAAREVRVEDGAALVGDRKVSYERRELGGRLAAIVIEGRVYRVRTVRQPDRILVWCDGRALSFERPRGRRSTAGGAHADDLVSPMPGTVRRTFVSVGDRVARGQVILVLEAMKMEHSIRAPRDGVVRHLRVKEGELVEAGVELAEIG
jgi:acetyl/propionyl-CoA carboxylase alpha subunit